MKKHHGQLSEKEPPFDCDYCGFVFADYKTLTAHLKLHLDRPNIQCLECERILVTKQALKVHMIIHVSSRFPISPLMSIRVVFDSSDSGHFFFHNVNLDQGNSTFVRYMRQVIRSSRGITEAPPASLQ